MKREIMVTGDGSKTIFIPEWNEQYHSKHGAIQEARHVFLKTGLSHYLERFPDKKDIDILEMGFGTGLNALLTFFDSKKSSISVHYTAVEAYPISQEEVAAMEYTKEIEHDEGLSIYNALHDAVWEIRTSISKTFQLTKRKQNFEQITDLDRYDLVYFDAFGPRVQPELWTEPIFLKMYASLKMGGVLTTYCAQGAARRAMQAVGFTVERLPGPPGKREMLRATKTMV